MSERSEGRHIQPQTQNSQNSQIAMNTVDEKLINPQNSVEQPFFLNTMTGRALSCDCNLLMRYDLTFANPAKAGSHQGCIQRTHAEGPHLLLIFGSVFVSEFLQLYSYIPQFFLHGLVQETPIETYRRFPQTDPLINPARLCTISWTR